MAALVATPQPDAPLGGEQYVVVTIEEVELSLNAVVALPSVAASRTRTARRRRFIM